MNKIFVFSVPFLALGLFFAPAAQAEEFNDEEGVDAFVEARTHMKKDAMMHKDSMMKKDTMMKDDTAPK